MTMKKVLSYGEILWDVIDGQAKIGGAPFNLAGHLARLGAETFLYSKVGADELGRRALQEIARLGVSSNYVKTDARYPTGTALVRLDHQGIPSYSFPEGVSYQHIEGGEAALASLREEGFSLFYFGSMVQMAEQSRETLLHILKECTFPAVFFDVNIRRDFCPREMVEQSLRYTTILKLNEEEALRFGTLFCTGEQETELIRALFAQYSKLRCVLVTKGPRGCTAYSREAMREINECVSKAVDTVGAGDAFSAGLISGLLAGWDVFRSARRGAILSDFVASSSGALPVYSEQLKAKLDTC